MSLISPFKGLRPPKELAHHVAAPPYDVVNAREAGEFAAGNAGCFFHITRPEIDLDPDTDIHSAEVYAQGRRNLQSFLEKGYLKRDDSPCFYIYQLAMEGKTQTGVVAGVSAEEYGNGLIKRHELTRPDKVRDRTENTLQLGINAGPVFLTFRNTIRFQDAITPMVSRDPIYDFESSSGVNHRFWVVDNPQDIDMLRQTFVPVPALYIADGHHRAETGFNTCRTRMETNENHTGQEPYNTFLAVLFPHDELRILEYNRLILDAGDLSTDDILERMRSVFSVEVSDATKPAKRHTFKMFLGDTWYLLALPAESVDEADPVRSLDSFILQDRVIGPVFGINDPRTDSRIDFVGGIRGMAELEKRCCEDAQLAFAMYPMSIEELLAIADSGELVPPKSTWFEPKLCSGLIVKEIE